jgi:3',5'-nucleoside bisphosphate phosphatase
MIDLHCHTTVSDGLLAPGELVRQGSRAGLKVLAITDHDDIRGYLRAGVTAQELGLTLIPAVEISSSVHELGVHILAYGFDPTDSSLQALLAQHRKAKQVQMREILARLRNFRIHIEFDEILGGRQADAYVGRSHVAKAMVPRYVQRSSTVYKRYIGQNGAAFVAPKLRPAKDVIETIHESGGLAVLAHPSFDDLSCTLPKLIEWGLDGLECFRPRCSRSLHDAIVSAAHHKNLIATGGSDWHGDRKIDRDFPFGEFQVEPEKVTAFLEKVSVEIGAP